MVLQTRDPKPSALYQPECARTVFGTHHKSLFTKALAATLKIEATATLLFGAQSKDPCPPWFGVLHLRSPTAMNLRSGANIFTN